MKVMTAAIVKSQEIQLHLTKITQQEDDKVMTAGTRRRYYDYLKK